MHDLKPHFFVLHQALSDIHISLLYMALLHIYEALLNIYALSTPHVFVLFRVCSTFCFAYVPSKTSTGLAQLQSTLHSFLLSVVLSCVV